jgi:hypothetical protein
MNNHKENCQCFVCKKRDYTGSNNPFYGKKHSKETIEKMKVLSKGRKHSKETRLKIGEKQTGELHWNYKNGNTCTKKIYYCIEPSCGKVVSKGNGRCTACAAKKNIKTKIKYICVEFLCLNTVSGNNKRCRSCASKHKFKSDKIKNKLRNSLKKFWGSDKSTTFREYLSTRMIKSDNFNWKGGISFLPYAPEFNIKLKKEIKSRDVYICKECNMTEKEHFNKYKKGLSVHHIDYNKNNNDKNNLITLCFKCNSKANKNREFWKEKYQNLLNGGLQCQEVIG